MKHKVLSLLVLLTLLFVSQGAFAQGPELPTPEPPFPVGEPDKYPPGGPWRTTEGLWYMPEGARFPMAAQSIQPLASGGADDFGYTWDDSVVLSWIDTTSGTDTGLTGDGYDNATGPISLPFSFKYYENIYSSLYIAASGYLAFTHASYWDSQSEIPSPSEPNNVIAPYWTPTYIGTGGWVRYLSGGTAPNRYFVVEWHDVAGGAPSDDIGKDELYRFEVVLYESGDIVFQYQTMTYNGDYFCGASGIEDSTGLDGLSYVGFCQQAPLNKAVRFYRPPASARVSVYPQYAGQFTIAGDTESFQFQIRNTGELGADTYDMAVSSSWLLSLYRSDGTTLLTDTDADGTVDTGPVAQGSTFTVIVKIFTPAGAAVGDGVTAAITVRSSRDPGKSKTATLQTAVPAPFAQVYRDNADGAMSLYLARPQGALVGKATTDWYYGRNVAVAETSGGNFLYAWTRGRSVGSVYVREIEYALLSPCARVLREVSKLTDHSGATMDTYDYSPAVVVAPNGRIGVLWYRYLWNSSSSQSNYNIWFAILDASGNVVYGPANITNNNVWGIWSDLNVPRFYNPRIAATGDNRFVLAWLREHQESGGWVDDIYYAVRESNGSEVKPITKLTNDTPGTSAYYAPALASLTSNRAFLSWVSRQDGNDDIHYAVLGSDGSIVKGDTDLSVDETVTDWWNYDAVQLSDGKILAAWEAWGCFGDEWTSRIRFAVLDSSYNRIGEPQCLGRAAAAISGDTAASVAADRAGHAIITWIDRDGSSRRNLYYALVDGSGSVLTPPMVFRTSQATSPYIETSSEGYGNTSYSPLRIYLPLIMR